MANIKSAKKQARQAIKRTAVNRANVSRIRTVLKKVEEAITSGSKEAAKQAFVEAQPHLQSGVNKGLFHKNNVARKLSRLSARIKKMAA